MTPEEWAEKVTWGGRPLPKETRQEIVAAILAAVAEEREACARLAEGEGRQAGNAGRHEAAFALDLLADAIRARGQQS